MPQASVDTLIAYHREFGAEATDIEACEYLHKHGLIETRFTMIGTEEMMRDYKATICLRYLIEEWDYACRAVSWNQYRLMMIVIEKDKKRHAGRAVAR